MTLHPVILPVVQETNRRTGPVKLQAQRRAARSALHLCAQFCQVRLGDLQKDEREAPLPFDGIYWSLTHKPHYAAAVLAAEPVGIDIEAVQPRSAGLFAYVATPPEWQCAGIDPVVIEALFAGEITMPDDVLWHIFFRYWTAKEAALKAVGIGIAHLKRCRIIEVLDETHLRIDYYDRHWLIAHSAQDGHLAAITQNNQPLEWHWHTQQNP
ncbi:MAG: 4'-phosphopantetheinyl transferase superfamily protein [Gemmatimonadetes bacterium]|nr:MAG: 4'-phosphopantetheinyl transferase superfamily protein [Gemmatimonadota bacterium]